MIQSLNVLIVDDHPIVVDMYKMAFEKVKYDHAELDFNVLTANDCDTAIYQIEKSRTSSCLELVLLDISLPASKDKSHLCGEDLGITIRKIFKTCKIIILTSHNDNFRLNSIFKAVNPEGFLIKEDLGFQDVVDAIYNVIADPPFYSKTIIRLLRQHFTNDFVLDEIDRQLLYNISEGVKMKDLPAIIPLSIGGLERRKRKLKGIFDVNEKNDNELILKAREKGYI